MLLTLSPQKPAVVFQFVITLQTLCSIILRVASTPNIPILTEFNTLKTVVSSLDESETGGTFENKQNVIPLWHILENIYLHQQSTKGYPIITGNITYQRILTHFIKPRESKTWDMRYHWLEDRIFQKKLIWKQGIYNWAQYFTKHCPPAYHWLKMPNYVVYYLNHYLLSYR